YRRFIAMYARIVQGVSAEPFDELLNAARERSRAKTDAEIPSGELTSLIEGYKAIVSAATGRPFPTDPADQLRGAIEAVFASWNGARAVTYRNREQIPHTLGTA